MGKGEKVIIAPLKSVIALITKFLLQFTSEEPDIKHPGNRYQSWFGIMTNDIFASRKPFIIIEIKNGYDITDRGFIRDCILENIKSNRANIYVVKP